MNKVALNKFLKFYIFFTICIIISIFAMITFGRQFLEANIYILITLIETIIIIYISLKENKLFKEPFFIYKLVFNVYFIGGILVYELRYFYLWKYIIFHEGDIIYASRILMICSLSLDVGYMLFNLKHVKVATIEDSMPKISTSRLILVSSLFCVLGWIAFLKLSKMLSIIPILSSNKNAARIEFMSNKNGIIIELYKLLYYSIVLSIINIVLFLKTKKGKRSELIKSLVILIVSYIPLGAYGSRFFIIFPILMSFVCLSNLGYKFDYKGLILYFILISIFIVLLSTFRSFGEINSDYLIRAISMDTFPEYSDFARMLITDYDKGGIYNAVILSGFLSFIPGKILALFGVDKSKYFSSIGLELLKYFPDAGQILGIRIGLVGELFLAVGFRIIIYFIIFGALLGALNNTRKTRRNRFSNKFVASNIFLLLALSIPYGFSFIPNAIISSIIIFPFLRVVDDESGSSN